MADLNSTSGITLVTSNTTSPFQRVEYSGEVDGDCAVPYVRTVDVNTGEELDRYALISESYWRYDGTQLSTNLPIKALRGEFYSNVDASPTLDNGPALIVGPRNGVHIEIDQNEIIAKATATTGSALNLGERASGNTSIWGLNVYLTPASGNTIYLNGKQRSDTTNTILWSGGYYMTANQTATLSENVSDQAHGIVLAWSAYTSDGAQNYSWNYNFVPKAHVANSHGGNGVSCIMIDPDRIGMKYVYVSNGKITGNDRNDDEGNVAGTNNVKFSNKYWVLRYVFGV